MRDFTTFIRSLIFTIDRLVFEWVGYIYNFLLDLAKQKIFTAEDFQHFADRIYVIIGIIILFKVVFTLIQIMSNPENSFIAKEGGTAQLLIPRLSITLILLILTPTIFRELYTFQSIVLNQNVIPRILDMVSGTSKDKQINIASERCVLSFEAPNPQFKHACSADDRSEDDSFICDAYKDSVPFRGTASKYIENTKDGIEVFQTGLSSAAHFVVDLSTNKTYFFSAYTSLQDYSVSLENNADYKDNILSVVINNPLLDVGGGKKCREYAVVSIGDDAQVFNSNTPNYYYVINFTDNKPNLDTLANNTAILKRTESYTTVSDSYIVTSGKEFSSGLLFSFAQPSQYIGDKLQDYKNAEDSANFYALGNLITMKSNDNYIITYSFIISTAFGIIVLLLLITSCFDIAVRSVALGFYQIIAPIPIASYIQSGQGKETMFNKYITAVSLIYIDIFTRVLAISFMAYLIEKVLSNVAYNPLQDNTGAFNWLLKLFMILGILLFAKEVPDIISGLFGKAGSSKTFELNPLKNLAQLPGADFAGALLGGGAVGAASGLVGGAIAAGRGMFKNAGTRGMDPFGKGIFTAGAGIGGALGGAVSGFGKGFGTTQYGQRLKENAKKSPIHTGINAAKSGYEAGKSLPNRIFKNSDNQSMNDRVESYIKPTLEETATQFKNTGQAVKAKQDVIVELESKIKEMNTDLRNIDNAIAQSLKSSGSLKANRDVLVQQYNNLSVQPRTSDIVQQIDQVNTQIRIVDHDIQEIDSRKTDYINKSKEMSTAKQEAEARITKEKKELASMEETLKLQEQAYKKQSEKDKQG